MWQFSSRQFILHANALLLSMHLPGEFTSQVVLSSLCMLGNSIVLLSMGLPGELYLSQCMRFPTMWYFDECRLGRASAASFKT